MQADKLIDNVFFFLIFASCLSLSRIDLSRGRSKSAAITMAPGEVEGSNASMLTGDPSSSTSVFKLRVEDLLTQLQPANHHRKQLSRVEGTLRRLKEILEGIEDVHSQSVVDGQEWLKKKKRFSNAVAVPWPEPRPAADAKWTVGYARPTSINVVGSFAANTQEKSRRAGPRQNCIDLAVTMPNSLFVAKDYVNYRYFHKRVFYLACLAAGIKEADKSSTFNLSYVHIDDNTLRPAVLLEPGAGASEDYKRSLLGIRVIPVIADDVFSVNHLLPSSNTIRHENAKLDDQGPSTTAIYNGSLLTEANAISFLKFFHVTNSKCPAFGDACRLGRTWLAQRAFGSPFSNGGFGNFEWSVLVAFLLEGGGANGKPILSPSYNAQQIFKAMIQYLTTRNLVTKPLITKGDLPPSLPKTGSPTIFDGKRGINVLYKMSPWSYEMLRHQAAVTLKMLNDTINDNFDRVFILRVHDVMCRYDQVVLLSVPPALATSTLALVKYQLHLYDILSRALTDRVKLLHLSSVSPTGSQEISAKKPKETSCLLQIGLFLDPQHVSRFVDRGPSPEEKEESESFRKFWGEKAELRRFKDGSINESLVWSDEDADVSVVQQILAHILPRQLGFDKKDMHFTSDDVVRSLRRRIELMNPLTPFGSYFDAFADMEHILRNLEGMPLSLLHISPSSPYLRYTAVEPQNRGLTSAEPVDVLLEFEGSARWPDDLAAIQMTKMAFLLKLQELLQPSSSPSSSILSCEVGLENENSRVLNSSFLDVLHSSNITFRFRIFHDREQALLERKLKDKELISSEREELAYALSAFRRTFIHSPRHTISLRALGTRYPALSPSIRLFKQWAYAHLSLPHVREELLELLVASVFTRPYPWTAPASACTGFFRTLYFLARWDWGFDPLIVRLNEEGVSSSASEKAVANGEKDINTHGVEIIRTNFTAWRKLDPNMNSVAMFVASNLDFDGVTWTQYAKPPRVVASRLTALAKVSMDFSNQFYGLVLAKQQRSDLKRKREAEDEDSSSGGVPRITDLQRPSLADYDFVLHLNPKRFNDEDDDDNESHSHSLGPRQKRRKFKNLETHTDIKTAPPSAAEIVQTFVNELQRVYGDAILFFHGGPHSRAIGGLWNPLTTKDRRWGLKVHYSTIPLPADDYGDDNGRGSGDEREDSSSGGKLSLNRAAILNEIALLGGELIGRVEAR